jgi:tRNA pseudouridine synthase 10
MFNLDNAAQILASAQALLRRHSLCNHCLGRQFGTLGHGLTNEERGSAIKRLLVMEGSRQGRRGKAAGRQLVERLVTPGFAEVARETLHSMGHKAAGSPRSCYVCRDTLQRVEELGRTIVSATSPYEFESFLVGIKGTAEVEDREDEMRSQFGLPWGENIRNEFSRELGKKITAETGKRVNFTWPDLTIIIDPVTAQVTINVHSLYVYGRYRKRVRGIPQTRWGCSQCNGEGCARCEFTGKLYRDSIEELIGAPFLEATKGCVAKLHAAGREDIDARVLGAGRPFVIEVKAPRVRRLDLTKVGEAVNRSAQGKIEVGPLREAAPGAVKALKSAGQSAKTYRAVVAFERGVDDDALAALKAGLEGVMICQKTPSRVEKRRVMKRRRRTVYRVELKRLSTTHIEMLVRCQGGLYVKELVHGDGGRTTPSVAQLADTPARCVELDVMDVELEGFE